MKQQIHNGTMYTIPVGTQYYGRPPLYPQRKKRRRTDHLHTSLLLIFGFSLVQTICMVVYFRNDRSITSLRDNPLMAPKELAQHSGSSSSIDIGDIGSGGSAFCLIIKDDNDVLSEWVAYHYHVFNMRRLIVAVDPDSKTSPTDVLKAWEDNFDLNVTVWNDQDYTPEYFHPSSTTSSRDYSKLPNEVWSKVTFVNPPPDPRNADQLNEPILRTAWHPITSYVKEHQEEVRKEVHKINDYIFRQKTFVSECFRKVKEEQQQQKQDQQPPISWVVNIDTDEYLVPNPWIASYIQNDESSASTHFQKEDLMAIFPKKASAGSLWSLFQNFFGNSFGTTKCVMMPRILFGSKEEGGNDKPATTTTIPGTGPNKEIQWSHQHFESLRWKYHADVDDYESNKNPKTIVNVGQIGDYDPTFVSKRALSIHRPVKKCPQQQKGVHNKFWFDQPIAVYHYLGSLERYLDREDDRRDSNIYKRKNQNANNNFVDPERWWIGGWLDSFVDTHGGEKVYKVLGDRYGGHLL